MQLNDITLPTLGILTLHGNGRTGQRVLALLTGGMGAFEVVGVNVCVCGELKWCCQSQSFDLNTGQARDETSGMHRSEVWGQGGH